ncbi:hypothetical protein [Actinopolymorpha rutila]|uniref:Uncharacterized protein n=1 Tax=Actinopolymorpha rutila TaxID=446787 RepID=A0A852ZEZ1_9ACTN|nr:hypothetical protein [Actinopolymorpha rutila]NYH88229.1 hypothetical protein [Actinopolymorpha rutila]
MSPTDDLVWVDEAYDRDYASDGVSRYGAYLRSRAHLFDDDGAPLDAVSFAGIAWQIACAPVMSPGFVHTADTIGRVRCRGSEESSEELIAEMDARLGWPARLARPRLSGWRDWERDDFGGLMEPAADRRALLFSVRVQLPVSTLGLPVPTSTAVDVGAAIEAVHLLCRRINDDVRPALDAVRETWREARR